MGFCGVFFLGISYGNGICTATEWFLRTPKKSKSKGFTVLYGPNIRSRVCHYPQIIYSSTAYGVPVACCHLWLKTPLVPPLKTHCQSLSAFQKDYKKLGKYPQTGTPSVLTDSLMVPPPGKPKPSPGSIACVARR